MLSDMTGKRTTEPMRDLPEILGRMPQRVQIAAMRAFKAAWSFGEELPPEFAKEMDAITIEGVDPWWQVEQLEAIAKRWERRR
jgi:hypothetical protein